MIKPRAYALLGVFFLYACASTPREEDVPEKFTPADLMLRAQESYDAGNITWARFYYQTVLDRFPNNESAVISAEFELAHILVKQKSWQDAYNRLMYILKKYEAGGSARLPPAYYKLTLIDLSRVKPHLNLETANTKATEYQKNYQEELKQRQELRQKLLQERTQKMLEALHQEETPEQDARDTAKKKTDQEEHTMRKANAPKTKASGEAPTP